MKISAKLFRIFFNLCMFENGVIIIFKFTFILYFTFVKTISEKPRNFHSTLTQRSIAPVILLCQVELKHTLLTFTRDDARILPIRSLSQYLFSRPGRGHIRSRATGRDGFGSLADFRIDV